MNVFRVRCGIVQRADYLLEILRIQLKVKDLEITVVFHASLCQEAERLKNLYWKAKESVWKAEEYARSSGLNIQGRDED